MRLHLQKELGPQTTRIVSRDRSDSASPWVICALAMLFLAGCQTAPIQSEWGDWEPMSPPRQPAPAPPPGLPVTAHPTPAAEEIPAVRPTPPPTPASPPPHRYRERRVDGPVIALTFDDGPSPRNTPLLLDILRERGIRVTFFVVGERAAAHPRILQRMAGEGHEIANHSWSHPRLTGLGMEALRWQVSRTSEAIEAAVGYAPALIRPPYGATNPELNRWFAEEMGLTVVLWSVDSLDWKHRNSDRVRHEILSHTRPGAIILAHDIHATTVAAMPATLDRLIAAGYQFVTVSELLDLRASE